MATGGVRDYSSDEGSDLLDLSEINAELSELSESAELEATDECLEWEELKAQQEFEQLQSNSSEESCFSGFETAHPGKRHSLGIKVEPKLIRSAPPSPTLVRTHRKPHSFGETNSLQSASVKEKIKSFENIAKHQEQYTKSVTPKKPVVKRKTRLSVKKGLTSPLASVVTQAKKRAKKRKVKRVLIPKALIMAQSDIPRAGRLNPRARAAGGVGETAAGLGFLELSPDNLPTPCRNVLRRFLLVREEMATDANLVLTDANVTTGKSAATRYFEEVVDCRERFDKFLEGVAEINPNTDAVVTEIYKVERELKNLIGFCELKMVNRPLPAPSAGDQIKLARLDFSVFDGTGNYRTWYTNFTTLAAYVHDDQTKKGHLLKALQGNAKRYVDSTMIPTSTYANIMEMLENRYNDPMAVNYNLLNRVFNSPELNLPQSTQAHWDSAVGDIKAILESGMGVGELLVFYRLHKFPTDTVRRVKDLHKIKYPGKNSINLEEAMDLMNKITAEEAELTRDTVSVEQCIQNLTLTATPRVTQKEAQPQIIQSKILPQVQHTTKTQSANNTFTRSNKGKSVKPAYEQYQSQPTNAQQSCQLCGSEEHNVGFCYQFTNPQEKRAELVRQKRCNKCAGNYEQNHQCNSRIWCRHCQGNHRSWLCIEKTPSK